MRYQVYGTRVVHVSVYVEAEDAEEALELASQTDYRDVEQWDVETNWYGVEPL